MDHGTRKVRKTRYCKVHCLFREACRVLWTVQNSVEKLYTLHKTQPDEITKNTLNCSTPLSALSKRYFSKISDNRRRTAIQFQLTRFSTISLNLLMLYSFYILYNSERIPYFFRGKMRFFSLSET